MGNAAIEGIEHENVVSQEKQTQPTSTLLSADNPNSTVNPVEAFLSGPYANMGDASGVSDAQIAAYMSSGLPQLASVGNTATFAAVNGGGSEPVDVTLPSFLADPNANSDAQLQEDTKWYDYAEGWQSYEKQISGGPSLDTDSIMAAEQAFEDAADAAGKPGYLDKLAFANDAINVMIAKNGWSYGPATSSESDSQPVTLAQINVTPAQSSSDDYAGLANYMAAVPSLDLSDGIDPGLEQLSGMTQSTQATTPNLLERTSSGLAADALALDIAKDGLKYAYGGSSLYLGITMGDSSAYAQYLLATGGRAPGAAAPALNVTAEAGQAAEEAAATSKDLGWLNDFEPLAKKVGFAGLLLEGGAFLAQPSWAGAGHLAFSGGTLALDLVAPEVAIPLQVIDLAAQQYHYNGKSGWTALWNSAWDSQEKMQQQDPKFYQQLWSQPKE